MNERWNSILVDGEQILWTGKPVRAGWKKSPDLSGIYTKLAVCAAALVLSILWLTMEIIPKSGLGVATVLFVCINVVPVTLVFHAFHDEKLLEKDSSYVITNRRVMAEVKGEVMAMERTPLLTCASDEWDGQYGNVTFGQAIQRPRTRSRLDAVLGIKDDDRNVTGMVFYHVDDPKAVAALAK